MNSRHFTKGWENEIRIMCLKGVHLIATIGLFWAFWLFNRGVSLQDAFDASLRRELIVPVGYTILLFLFIRTYNAYLLGFVRIRNLVLSEIISQIFSTVIVCVVSYIIWNTGYGILSAVLLLAAYGVLDVCWALWSNRYYYRLNPTKRAILIYRNAQDRQRFEALSGKPSEKLYRIEKQIRYTGHHFFEIRDLLSGYEAIFIAGIDSRCRNGIAKYCLENNVPGYFIPHTGDIIMQGAVHIQSFDSPIFRLTRKHLKPEYRFIKRAFDIFFSALGLLILSPLMALIAAIVRLSDGGPAIYRQDRLTLNGRIFKILKFRTMRVDAESDGIAKLSTGSSDDRVTPVGRLLRRTRLDELPQLFNILKGEMSFVGPRPERPEIAEEYYRTLPDFALRLQVKAGLTGYAQVYGRYNTDPYEKMQFDLLYINKMNFFIDTHLMFATLSALISARSTQGVEIGAVNAMRDQEVPDVSAAEDWRG